MKNTYRIENDKIIKGVTLPIFIHNLHYHLADLNVYEDGKIDCWELVDFEGFKEKIKTGWIKTSIPQGEKIFAFPLGNIETSKFHPNRSENELIKEVEAIINRFQGKKTSEEFCSEAFEIYKATPNEENRKSLQLAYEQVAEHNRRFLLGDMDVDDIPIRVAIYGDKVFGESYKGKIQEKLIREYYLKGIEIIKTATNNG
jgi:hypothetical protein